MDLENVARMQNAIACKAPLVDAMCADTERECSGVVGANYLVMLDMQLGTYS